MRVRWSAAGLAAATLVAMTACSGGGDSGGSDPVASGVSGNFVADLSPICPNTAVDTLSLRKVSVLGRNVILGLQVTDCNSSLGVYGVNFDLRFDPSVVQCPGVNPCTAGTLLSPPLATSGPQCTCDNGTGEILGTFTKAHPGTNETISPGGSKDVVVLTLNVVNQGASRLDFLSQGSMNGSSIITLSGSTPLAAPGLDYQGGSLTGQ